MVYGLVSGVSRQVLDAMIELEQMAWGSVQPAMLFLIRRHFPYGQSRSINGSSGATLTIF